MKFLQTLLFWGSFVGLLGSCTVYDSVFHPHRLPTPPMSATARAKVKAAEKARHKGLTLKPEETITDGASAAPAAGAGTGAGAAAPATEKPKTLSYNELPAGTKLTYDKQGLLKKNKLDRLAINGRRLHRYDTRPLKPREASRENRKLRKHSKGKGKASPGREAPDRPTPDEGMRATTEPAPKPDPTQPAAKPTKVKAAKAAKPEKVKAEKPEKIKVEKPVKEKAEKSKSDKKTKKAPVPKPDPTQPQPFKGDQ